MDMQENHFLTHFQHADQTNCYQSTAMLGIKCYFLDHKMRQCTQTDKAMVLRVSLIHWLSIPPYYTDGMILRTEASCGHTLTQMYASIYCIIPNIIISSCSSKMERTALKQWIPRSNTVNDIMRWAGILWKERKRNFPGVKCAISHKVHILPTLWDGEKFWPLTGDPQDLLDITGLRGGLPTTPTSRLNTGWKNQSQEKLTWMLCAVIYKNILQKYTLPFKSLGSVCYFIF